jgi:hypothetical protein
VANNVIYNWMNSAAYSGNSAIVDWLHNYFKRGPATPAQGSGTYKGLPILVADGCQDSGTPPCYYSIHAAGNLTSENNWGTLPDEPWEGPYRYVGSNSTNNPQEGGGWSPGNGGIVPEFIRRATPLEQPAHSNIQTMTHSLASDIIAASGHNRRLNPDGTWLDIRDATDQQRIDWFFNGGGPSSTVDVSHITVPVPASGTAPTDTDDDGVPDAWVQRFYGKNTLAAAGTSAGAMTPSGYLVIEHYLNGTNPND